MNKIHLAKKCGLIFTGEYEEGQPQFIGNDKEWKLFENYSNKQGELDIEKYYNKKYN